MRAASWLSIAALALAVAPGSAQSQSLSIKVVGPGLEVLPGATVVVSRPESWQAAKSVYRGVTGLTGVATFDTGQVGVFDVTACLTGFVPTRLLHIPGAGTYYVLLNIDSTPPDQHMLSGPEAPAPVFNPCAASTTAGTPR